MKNSIAVTAIALMFAVPATAQAAPATVMLRVEGASQTIFEAPVTTDGKMISKAGVAAPCGNTDPGNPVPTMTSALDDGSLAGGFDWDADYFGDFYVNRIGPDANDFANNRYWGIALNLVPPSVGGCQQQVADGNEVLFAYDFFQPDFSNKPLLKLEGPQVAETGTPATLQVSEIGCVDFTCAATTTAPATGAAVAGQTVGADGTATVLFPAAGTAHLKAEKTGTIRSNAIDICVHAAGDGGCQDLPPKFGTKVKDSSLPSASISSIRNGAKLRRGPRILKGTAKDTGGSGLKKVKLSLRRHIAGRCSWWSATAERFSGRSCKRKVFFSIGDRPEWSYQLAKALGKGHYVLDVKAVDGAGNADKSFARGRNRVVFDVVGRGSRSAKAAKRRPGASVAVMVVGRSGEVLSAARAVKAKATTTRASGRRCLVGASTPLSALLAATRKGPSLSVKDFGSCSATNALDAGQLFVRAIGGQSNEGADGWVYKLRDKVPSLGAGDRLARLKNGNRLLWFYCLHDAGGNCQPTLRVEVPGSVAASTPLKARVLEVDDQGRATPAAGATVSLSGQSALTGPDGIASLQTPARPGAIRLVAALAGTITSFPQAVTVGSTY